MFIAALTQHLATSSTCSPQVRNPHGYGYGWPSEYPYPTRAMPYAAGTHRGKMSFWSKINVQRAGNSFKSGDASAIAIEHSARSTRQASRDQYAALLAAC